MTIDKSQHSRAVEAILSSPSLEKAAKSLKVNPSTLWRWMQDPKMQMELFDARQRLLSGAITGLQAAMQEAVETLREVMSDKGAPSGTRLTAARIALDMSLKGRSVLEVEGWFMRLGLYKEETGDT